MSTILGLDIGGVIIDCNKKISSVSFFGEHSLESAIIPNSFKYIALLNHHLDKNVHLVSKCSVENEQRILAWLKHHDFYHMTDMDASQIHFCRERIEKRAICEQVGITDFVDDNQEVLEYLLDMVPLLYLFSLDTEPPKLSDQLFDNVLVVNNWDECYQTIMK